MRECHRLAVNSMKKCGRYELAMPNIWKEPPTTVPLIEWRTLPNETKIEISTNLVVQVEEPMGPAVNMVKELVEIIKRDQGLDPPSKPMTLTEKEDPSLKPAIPVWAEVNSQGVPKIVQAMIDTQLKAIHCLYHLTPGPGA